MSSRRFLPLLSAACLVAPLAPAWADIGSGSDPAFIQGRIELEYAALNGPNLENDPFILFDGQAAFAFARTGDLSFGIQLGMDAADFPGASHVAGLEAVVYSQSAFGVFAIGSPFSALSDATPDTAINRTGFADIVTNNIRPTLDSLARAQAQLVPGARFDGDFGNLGLSLSYHAFTGSSDITGFSGALTYQTGAYSLAGGVEVIENAGTDFSVAMLSGAADLGLFEASLTAERFDLPSNDYTAYTLGGNYNVTDRLSIGAARREFVGRPGANTSWVVEAEYGFGHGGFVSASAGQSFGSDEASLGVGLNF